MSWPHCSWLRHRLAAAAGLQRMLMLRGFTVTEAAGVRQAQLAVAQREFAYAVVNLRLRPWGRARVDQAAAPGRRRDADRRRHRRRQLRLGDRGATRRSRRLHAAASEQGRADRRIAGSSTKAAPVPTCLWASVASAGSMSCVFTSSAIATCRARRRPWGCIGARCNACWASGHRRHARQRWTDGQEERWAKAC